MVYHAKDNAPTPKAFFTHGVLPAYVDEQHLPQKRKPFSTLLNQKWSHTVDVILPVAVFEIVNAQIETAVPLRYAKVILSLSDILDGDFFNEYVKKGDISMLSEGRPGVDNMFSLDAGTLRLELDKATYERAGLVGKPTRDGGLKHQNNRYVIQLDLRQPSMLHGKKGFERIVWAAKRVLNHSLTWLFHDRGVVQRSEMSPIAATRMKVNDFSAKHHPTWHEVIPIITQLPSTRTPPFEFPSGAERLDAFKDGLLAADIEEWIALVALQSPRVRAGDSIDSYLCRYSLPTLCGEGINRETVENLVRVRWCGFLPSDTVIKLILSLRKASRDQWMATLVHGFRGESLTLMKLPRILEEDQYLEWEHPAQL